MHIGESSIAGLRLIEDINVLADSRGTFRTWWRSDWDGEIGGMKIAQLNISDNFVRGTTRGSHVAPWDKLIHPFYNRAFAVIIDARRGSPTFGSVESFMLDQSSALFVPKGCGNAYQAVDDFLVYGYAVNELWYRSDQEITVSLFDSRFHDVDWPIPDRSQWVVSDKDLHSRKFDEVFGG